MANLKGGSTAGGSLILTIEDLNSNWHEIGTTGEPAFQNGWVNYTGSEYTTCAFKKVGSFIYLKGLVSSGTVGTTTPIFTLPVGMRPSKIQHIVTTSNGLFGYIYTKSDGMVTVGLGSATWVSLDGLVIAL